MLKLDTTSPVTRMKSERTRDLASTSRSTSPRERYRSDVTNRTALGDVGRHHLDFLQEGKKNHQEGIKRLFLQTQSPSACQTCKGIQGASCDSELSPGLGTLRR